MSEEIVMKVKMFSLNLKPMKASVILSIPTDKFERLMCEVEFWEVFYVKYEGF